MFQRVMALTNEERLLMGLSMLETSRAIVWGSLPADLDMPTRRKVFYQRFYGQELPEEVARW
ncbi:hypothetical protein [Prosthecobacter fusiformis]|nr:hypothetical protein [Prosthecobacter fusiformis]